MPDKPRDKKVKDLERMKDEAMLAFARRSAELQNAKSAVEMAEYYYSSAHEELNRAIVAYLEEKLELEEVGDAKPYVSEIRPRPDDPSCHVCGAQMAVKEWKCLSCKATTGVEEVSPPAELSFDQYADLLYSRNKWHMLCRKISLDPAKSSMAKVVDYFEGDTRELKAALRKLANEAKGFVAMADFVRHGNTNIAVIKQRIAEAEKLLG